MPSAGKDANQKNPHSLLVEMQGGTAILEDNLTVFLQN